MPRKRTVRPNAPSATLQEQYPLPPGCEQRYFREGDEESMLDVLDKAFDGWPKVELSVPPIEHLRWKLRMHEAALRSHIVAVIDGRCIAVRPLWAPPVKVDDNVLLGRHAIDRAVLPEFQRHGMMAALEVRMPPRWAERFDLTLSLRSNWQRINLTPGQSHPRKLDVVACSLDAPPPVAVIPGDLTLRSIDTFDDRFDDFWAEASVPYRVMVARTAQHLNYRFGDRRAGNYRIVVAEREGRVLGYVITTARERTGYIADALVLPGRNDVLESLLADAVSHLRMDGKASVECWRFPYHPYVPSLEKLGFHEPRRTETLNLRSLNGRDREFEFFEEPKEPVHYMAGDTDLV